MCDISTHVFVRSQTKGLSDPNSIFSTAYRRSKNPSSRAHIHIHIPKELIKGEISIFDFSPCCASGMSVCKGFTLMRKESHMASVTTIKECAHAFANPKTRKLAIERAKARAPHKKAWANLLDAMENGDNARVKAYTLDFGARIKTLVSMQEPKATAKAKPKATPKAKAQPKADEGLIAGLANVASQMSDAQVMAFLNVLAEDLASRKK